MKNAESIGPEETTADDLGFLSEGDRRAIRSCLPAQAVADIELACVQHFWLLDPDEATEIEPALRRVSDAAQRLHDALAELPSRGQNLLLMNFEHRRAGRLLFGRHVMFSDRRIITRSKKGWRLLRAVVQGLADAADWVSEFDARTRFENGKERRVGRPMSDDWSIIAGIAAVSIANGITPSEASTTFMEIVEAVWRSAGIAAGPTHAVRAMRKMLKEHTEAGGRYLLKLHHYDCLYEVAATGAGKWRSERMSWQEWFWRRYKQSRRIAPPCLAPEKGDEGG